MIVIDNPNPEDHLRTEWLLTNGLGGYAMGTVLGVNTRRYHGLLVAATKPPVGRIVALHSMIEQLVIPHDDGTEEVIDLSTQMFVGPDGKPMLHPQGWKRMTSFRNEVGRRVEWDWEHGEVLLTRSVELGECRNESVILYRARGARAGTALRLRPLIALRGFHELGHDPQTSPVMSAAEDHVEILRDGIRLALGIPGVAFRNDPQWWWNLASVEERNRGLDWREHVWSPGFFEFPCDADALAVPFSAEMVTPELERPQHLKEVDAPVTIYGAAGQFIVRRSSAHREPASVIAGYPWFADWGRDAMISLPGLLLCANRFDEAGEVLHTFARHMKNGLIPNRFDDQGGAAHYNSVDASLWFVYAVWQYVKSGQPSAVSGQSELIDACREVINAYRDGTDFNIRMDADGLITAGDETTQLTWMDAKRDGVVFTPRHGKAVEVNALWFNALHCLADMTDDEDEARALREIASRGSESFRSAFWWQQKKFLHDVLVPRSPRTEVRGPPSEGESYHPQVFAPDGKLRPNQILAVSLPYSPLARDQQRAILDCVRERFLTPFGLRTLDREDPGYQPRYDGNLFERDRAYHNGSVWPWLIGPYCESILRVGDFDEEARREVRAVIQPLLDELDKTTGPRCLGQLAEVYDGDPPHRPSGCTAQAWSVAEVLRICSLVEQNETTNAQR